ncbi:zinc finger protein 638 [Cyrtonyx montezumae]|uniref:zinc finger protein 638 n=1 Tax=Cyrtonyx montezumae TaxID=9017 RepID=UPI0032DA82AC
MFGPRGALPQRPRGPNPSGAKPPGSFQGGGAAAPQRPAAPGAPQGPSGRDGAPWGGSQRINVRVTLHRADPRQAKAKSNLHQEPKAEPRGARWDGAPCPPAPCPPAPCPPAPCPPAPCPPPGVPQKLPGPARLPERSRYTPESASSILASFGLSNEDLEELSRYPDEQLTPENMPLILREIRLRKMGQPPPGPHPQSRGEALTGKVIDYGHASKYGYTEDPLEVLGEDPLEARPYSAEAPSADKRDGFRPERGAPMGIPPAGVPCGPPFPPQDVVKPPPAFQSDPANPHPFFPAEPAGKAGGLCAAPVAKAGPPPAVLPVLPPMLPLAVPPAVPPPLLPQPVVPLLPQPPFSAELLAILEQRGRTQQEPGSGRPGAPSSAVGQKPSPTQPAGPVKSPFGVVKASWLPAFLQCDAPKMKRLPTPSMMNDYYATSPRIFPHLCSLCNVECARMKDWILHQNTPSHIDSCRHLRQQYPDWNPESRSSKRNAADRKENQTPKHRSSSASPGPRRPRAAGSSHVPRHSRSRSRSPGRYRPTRPRSRSPRQARHLSPRHWSRSPQRSRNPLPGSPRPQRSSSNDWSVRRAARSQDRKAALEAVMKTLGPGFVAEFNKHKPAAPGSAKPTPSHGAVGKKAPKASVAAKKDALPPPAAGSSSPQGDQLPREEEMEQEEEEEEEEEGSPAGPSRPRAAPYNRLLRDELLNCGTVLQISNLPDDGFSDHDIKKIVQPFGKVSDLIVLRSRNKAYLEMNYKEAVIAAVKYGETAPVLVNGRQVKISVAEKPKASPSQGKTSVRKKSRLVRRAAPSSGSGKQPAAATKATKPLAEPGAVPPAEPSEAAGRGQPGRGAAVWELCRGTDAHRSWSNPCTPFCGTAAPVLMAEGEEGQCSSEDADDGCVVVVSNLPEKGHSVEEVSNLAKPFGALRDVLIVSPHKQAYLETSRKSAESMVRFYSCFPMTLDGNLLSIAVAPEHRSVSDEEAIFTALIKDSDPKVNAATLRQRFVHLGNLPARGCRDFELVCVGLRFGKVEHYVVLKNRNKAILQLESPTAARSMCCFLNRYSYTMGEHTLSCSLSPGGQRSHSEAVKKEGEEEEEQSRGSPGSAQRPAAPAARPPLEPSAALQEPSTPRPAGGARGDPDPCSGEAAAGAELLGSPPARIPAAKPDEGAQLPRVLDEEERGERAADAEEKGTQSTAPPSTEMGLAETRDSSNAASSSSSSSSSAAAVASQPASVPKILLKAVVAVPDILKPRGAAQRNKSPPNEGRERAAPSQSHPQGAAVGRNGAAPKEHARPKAQPPAGRSASTQDELRQLRCGAASTRSQDGRRGSPGTSGSAKSCAVTPQVSAAGNARSSRGGSKLKEEEELFPFNLDEFVTVDEVLEDGDGAVKAQLSPPKAKRKECSRGGPGPKRRKAPAFVMLDQIGEEEEGEAGTQLGMLVVDEVTEEEASKAEPLVTVDEIGEVEELPLNEPAGLSGDGGMKEEEEEEEEGGSEESSVAPDDALLTVDEIREDDDDDDFLADFNRLKEELNFVTVDEVGEEDEEEENAPAAPRKSPPHEGGRGGGEAVGSGDHGVAAVGPEEMETAGVRPGQEEMGTVPVTEAPPLCSPPRSPSQCPLSPGLDYVVPKAGFFCQICSLFYSDETSVKNHCRTALHRRNAQRFMATRKEERSGGAECGPR